MTQTGRPKAYITTPIYYPSGKPHLGSAYTTIAADVYARFKRLDGYDTLFATGTDEHGLKLQRAAEKEGLTPQAYVDMMAEQFRALEGIANLSEHVFIRTTEPRHLKTAQKMWRALEENGFIYKASYAGWYCVSDETYYQEDELKDGKSPISGHPVEWMEEESYFFKLSAFREKLIALHTENPQLIQPASRRNEVLGFLKQEVHDISISRTTFDWGVPVPDAPGHIMYVWIDALTNYLTVLDWAEEQNNMAYWPAVHVVGKDILRFHAIYWPAMLLGAGFTEAQMPRVYAHGWWTVSGDKMSKSKGNVVDPADLAEAYGADAMRYFLLREVPFGNDGDFARNRLVERINSDLANALGNLFQRVLSMVHKNCEAQVPALGSLNEDDHLFLAQFNDGKGNSLLQRVRTEMEALQFHKALEQIWLAISAANQYMDKTQPWILRKEDPERMAHTLRVLMEGFCHIALLLEAFMPKAAQILQEQVGITGKTFKELETSQGVLLKTGAPLLKPEGVFPRIQSEEAA